MKNLYKQTMEEIKLDDAAKERIYNGVVNKLKEEKTEKKRTPFSLKAFRLATACASAALVCGAAIGTGVYFGKKDKGNEGTSEGGIPYYYCYYIGYELETFEQPKDNFELNLYYGFDEQAVRGRYDYVLREAEEKGYGEVLKYEIILAARTNHRDENNDYDRVVFNRMEIDDIDKFPFDDYRVNIVEQDGETVERTYTHSEKIKIPSELFVECDFQNAVNIYLYERIEYEIGCTGENLSTVYWTNEGKVANDKGTGMYFYPINACAVYFLYDLKDNKVVIDKAQFDDYEFMYITESGTQTEIRQSSLVRCNFVPIYQK